jgi:hypothetical protein
LNARAISLARWYFPSISCAASSRSDSTRSA